MRSREADPAELAQPDRAIKTHPAKRHFEPERSQLHCARANERGRCALGPGVRRPIARAFGEAIPALQSCQAATAQFVLVAAVVTSGALAAGSRIGSLDAQPEALTRCRAG
jgi:hypothetical protein